MFINKTNIGSRDWDHVGGKARGLLRLESAGFKVPAFRILSARIFDAVVNGTVGPEAFAKISSGATFEVLRQMTKDLDLRGPVAVRSSGLLEDHAEHSFAGVHESELNVSGADEIARAIQRIWASALSERAQHYRDTRKIEDDRSRMAVVVQEMIQPLYSGVAFGLNPTTGDRQAVWISLTRGLGEALVSGEVRGNEYVYEAGELRDVDASVPVASLPFLNQIVQFTQQLGALFGGPQDIEWAWDGKSVWLLQARPITAKIETSSRASTVFDNSNIQESYCGITTPLTFSYASTAYSQVYDQTLKFMGVPAERLKTAHRRHKNMLGLIEGRVYYNINNWYATLLDLPSFGKRKAEMEDMMGLESPVDFVIDREVPLKEKLQTLPTFAFLITKLIWKFASMSSAVNEFDRWFWSIYRSVDQKSLFTYSDQLLVTEIARLQDAFLEKWGIPILNDLKCMMMMGSVKRALAKYGLEQDLKAFMYGAEIESLKPTLEIHRLCRLVAASPVASDAVASSRGSECLERLRVTSPALATEIEAFIDLHGDRCMGELKLETITMRQDSEIFFNLIRSFIAGGVHESENLFAFQDERTAEEKLAKLPFLARWSLKRKISKLKVAVADREKLRFHRTRNFGLMRTLYIELGRRWAAAGHLNEPRDIFYLTIDEIDGFGHGRSVNRSLIKLVEMRKDDFANMTNTKLPAQIAATFPVGATRVLEPTAQTVVTAGAQLKGLACSQGIVEGTICFVTDAAAVQNLTGKILLAERTDPGWTPLFALVKGVIVERGSMLSHSAVIAREMGIPAVLNIENVTSILQEGDYVRLNGHLGTVEIIERTERLQDAPISAR